MRELTGGRGVDHVIEVGGPGTFTMLGDTQLSPWTIVLHRRFGLWVPAAIGWSAPAIGLITALCPSALHSSGPPFPLLFGLAIAVPAIWLHRGLSSQTDLLLFEADRMSLSIVDQIGEQLDGAIANAADRKDK